MSQAADICDGRCTGQTDDDRADKEVAEMSKIEVNEKRVVDEFQELTAIDAPSFGEREMADRLIPKLKELGFEVEEDNAGEHFGGNAGNLYAYLPGDLPGDPILLSGHMDTVEPSKGKKGIIGEDGVIRSAGKAVLGADDVAGLVEILEAVRILKEKKREYHTGISRFFLQLQKNFISRAAVYLIFQRSVQKKLMYWISADRLEARHIKHRP